jgi:glucose/arabinose dehydrogenase/PKD repeat protein/chitodextrinase
MRVGRLTIAVSVVVVAFPAAALGHGRASTHAEHRAEDAAPHNAAAEPQLMKHTRAVTALDAQAAAAAVAGNEHEVGSWGALVNWPVVGVHVALLPNGKVVAYDSVGDAATETFPDHTFTRATVWDPETGTQTEARVNTGFNVFCSGLAHLPDGSLFLAGGNRNAQLQGIAKTHVFDHTNNGWSLGADMAFARWYPTVTPLRNGEMLITEGGPDIPEVRSTTGALRSLGGASLNLPLYPWIDVAPDGRAFYSGPNQTMRALDTAGTGAWQSFGQRDALNRDYGSHALYDVGRILVAGGGPSSRDARVININGATPQVSATAPMANGRRQHNLTVLADGTVLATGGNSSGASLVDLDHGVYAAELWNPATGTWSTVAPEQATRQYHSTALLLPDGRVLSSGGGICGTCDDVGYLAKNAQVFTPPYLFKTDGSGELAPRPAIASAPAGVAYGSGFQIDTPDAAAIRKVALVRLGAVTHSVNMEQRYVPLTFTAGAGTLAATAPANANIAPPGVYMLFIVDDNGVPSVAKMVTVSASAPPPTDNTPPSAPTGLTATAAGSSQVNLSWTAATDNVGVTGYRVERCQGAGCSNFTEVATPTGTTYNDTGRSASTTYRYRVRAADAASNLGGYSPEAQATTSSVPATPQGLVGAWAFSEGSGSTTADASGNGNVGTITNATWSTQGRYGNALSFNGTSSVVRVPSAASLNLTTGMTLSAWIRPTASQSGWRTIVQRQADAYFVTSSNDQPMRPAGGGTIGGGVRFVGGPTANPLNTWTHVAVSFDGNQLRLYVNGTQVATRGANGTIQTVANPLWIGGNQPYGEYFQGLIDEVRVYNRALTATDIQTDMNTSIVPTAPDTTAPSAPSGLTATAASANQVNLSWTASNDNVGVTGYRVERCTGATCTVFNQVGTPTTTTFNDTGLTPSTTHRYQVRAVDQAGNFSSYSTIASATTPAAADTTPPSAPTGLTATAITTTRIDLAWTASTDNVGVIQYRVERCQGATCTDFAEVGSPATTAYSNTDLTANTSYRFRVRAVDAAGNLSPYSAIANGQTLAGDTTAPTAPAGLTATAVSPTQIDLAWTASTDNVGVTGYRVERCEGATCTNFAEIGTPATTSHSDTGRTPATAYRYRVRAVDAAGNFSAYSTIAPATTPPIPDSTPPTAPTGLTASPVGSGRVDLGWTASTDSGGVAGYQVERCQGPGCSIFAQVASPTATTHSDTGLSPSTTYRYRVRAVDTSNNLSGYSGVAEATTGPAPDTSPPSASVTAPPAGSVVSGNVTVSANANDNVGVAGVQFLLDGSSLGAEDTTAPYSMTWDTTSASNGVHTLQARARDTAGNVGTSSSSVTVTVSNTAPPVPSGLVAGWAFNESLGTTVNDVSGNGNSATLQNDPTWTAGKYGGGLRFDGVNDFLTVLNSPSINVSGTALTLSMWINPLAGGGDQVPFAKFWSGTMASPFYQYGLELGGGTTPVIYFGTAGGLTGASMGSPLALGQWSHLAIVFDGARAQFYVNGTLVSSPPVSATISARDSLLYMAADVRPTQFFRGTLDDVRVYRRAQTQLEVLSDMNAPLSAPAFDPTAPSVAITDPANDAVVSGNRTITASATDDVGVAGVQFYVDGSPMGPEDTAAPYAANWDTRLIPNGARTLTARARDTDGKTTLSALVNVTVANSDHFQNQVLATGFDLPMNIEFLPDGRMLVAELAGKVKVLSPPYTTPDPSLFLEISNIAAGGVQQGIFDIELDPNFANNHYYYVFYTLGTPTVDRLARFTANAALTGTVPGSELVLYQDPGTAFIEHHGGAVTFGNDGKIYFTTGDHFAGTPSQELSSPRGKVHRIFSDGLVPLDNPFHDGAGPNWDSVWAYGLRNPFRAYHDIPTDRLYIGDVGGNVDSSNEELNVGARGANYGWPDHEGPCPAPCRSPIYDYEHNGGSASITGGFVYHGAQFPDTMQGNYFFADYAQRWIKRLAFDANGNVSGIFNFEPISGNPNESAGDVVYLTEGPDGALYYVDLGYSDITGTFGVSKIRRIRYLQSNQAPVALASANVTSGAQPLDVAFSSAGSNDPEGQPLTYSWDFGDGTSSTASNPVHTFTQAGQYVVRLTVSDGTNSSISTPLTIRVGNVPTATIDSPTDGATFRAGDVISYEGHATDVEDGNLPASAFTWNVDFLHDSHVHPTTVVSGVKSSNFTIPTSGHDFQGNTRYRITLTVTDANGLKDTKSIIVSPQKVDLSFNTAPPGLTLYVDGIARTTPFVLDTLIGFNHTLEARDQSSGANTYTFNSWSDGGARSHTITVPGAAQSYTASYNLASAPSGLVGAWAFNEGTGSTSADASGNGNTATLVNGPAWVPGKYGTALSFDQVNDSLSIANSTSLDISGNAMTISMWINPATISGDSVVLGKFWNAGMTSPYYQYGLELSGGRPQFYIGTATGLAGAGMDTALALNQWSHLAIVFNGSQAQFYLNGALAGSKSLNASITARGRQLRIGADADPWQFYKGILDNMRIYNRTLTPGEIQTDMNTGL